MNRIGVAIPVVLLLGSMKYLEHRATSSMLSYDSFLCHTTIDAEPVSHLNQFSLLPVTPMPEDDESDDGVDTEVNALSSEEIDAIMLKCKKLYVAREILRRRMQTDIVPDYSSLHSEDSQELVLASTQEMAYAIDALVDEESVVIQESCSSRVKLFMKESKDTIFLVVAHVQEKSGKPLEIIHLILNSDGSEAVK